MAIASSSPSRRLAAALLLLGGLALGLYGGYGLTVAFGPLGPYGALVGTMLLVGSGVHLLAAVGVRARQLWGDVLGALLALTWLALVTLLAVLLLRY